MALFHEMMHKEIKVYVDDMIAKSKYEEEHIINLRKLFERLRKFKLKLNPVKCTFGVKFGKLLGLIVSEKGIEVDLDKVRAILEMPFPHIEKEVSGFLGRLNYIDRFISQLTATCEPIFKLLRKNMSWNGMKIVKKPLKKSNNIYKSLPFYVRWYPEGLSSYT